MELEFKCQTQGCNFKVRYDWPEDQPPSVDRVVLEGKNKHRNPLSDHHDATKITLEREHEYRGMVYGHGAFTAHYKRRVIEVKASTYSAVITNYIEDELHKGIN